MFYNNIVRQNNNLAINKAKEELLKTIRFYLVINNNLIDLTKTTQAVTLDLEDASLAMVIPMYVSPVSLEETAEGITVRFRIAEDGYDPEVIHSHLLDEGTLTDCENILYAMESITSLNCIRQFYLKGPSDYCEAVAGVLAREVEPTDTAEDIETKARRAKRVLFGRTNTTFGGIQESHYEDIFSAEQDEKSYAEGFVHLEEISGESDNFITIRQTAQGITVTVNRWDYDEQVRKFDNGEYPYNKM